MGDSIEIFKKCINDKYLNFFSLDKNAKEHNNMIVPRILFHNDCFCPLWKNTEDNYCRKNFWNELNNNTKYDCISHSKIISLSNEYKMCLDEYEKCDFKFENIIHRLFSLD